jgi:hypothetical protein
MVAGFSRLLRDIDLIKMLPFASFFEYILCPFFRLQVGLILE